MFWNDPIARQHEALKEGLKHPTATQDLKWLENKIKELEGNKAAWRIKKVFKDADLEVTHAVRYNRLCVETHNNGSFVAGETLRD